MAELLLKAAGGLVGLALVWFLSRALYRSMIPALPPELEQALRLQKSDPAKAEYLAEQYYRREGLREEAEQSELLRRASVDASAATELRQRLQDDFATNAAVLQEHGDDAALRRNVEQDQERIRKQLAALEALIDARRIDRRAT